MTDIEMIDRAKEVFSIEIAGLERTRDALDACFVRAIRMMLDCTAAGGIVVVSGVGKNLHIAEKMSAIFASTGTRSIVLNPVQAMHGDLGMVSPRDILIALSFSGESAEVNNLIPAIRRHGLKVISMTGNAESTLAKLSDCHILIPCGKEACPFGMAPTNSTTATMAMGDALAMVMIDAQKFAIEDYAMNHPAGAIGRALVMKVSDVMRTGERLAKVAPTATVMDALMAMTKAQGGSAVIADEAGMLLGIFTDGDFRRNCSDFSIRRFVDSSTDSAIEKFVDSTDQSSVACNASIRQSVQSIEESTNRGIEKFLSSPVGEFMTRHPLFVRDDAYAAELLKIFERRHIDDLPVCDGEGRVVGLVDLQDLPKMKVL